MKALLPLLLAVSLSAQSQAPAPQRATADASPAEQKPAAVDPKLHTDVLRLVEISGARQQVQASFAESVAGGREKTMEKCPHCTPEFGEEWSRRMTQRLNAAEFVAVFIEEYEKYLADADVLELISLRENAKAIPPPVVSAGLKTKIDTVMPNLMSDIVGRCAVIAAKLEAEVGQEIGAEHPEWVGEHAAAKP